MAVAGVTPPIAAPASNGDCVGASSVVARSGNWGSAIVEVNIPRHNARNLPRRLFRQAKHEDPSAFREEARDRGACADRERRYRHSASTGVRMMKVLIAAALVVSSSAGLAQTAAPAVSTDGASPKAKAKPPKPICRSLSVTGSMFPARSCHSKEEWVAIDAANAADADQMSNSRTRGGQPSN
jgi:hypothetical protein